MSAILRPSAGTVYDRGHRRRTHQEGTRLSAELREQYLDLLKLTLTGLAEAEPTAHRVRNDGSVRVVPADLGERNEGRDWPQNGLTMVGMKRLENVQACIEDVLAQDVPGDLIETGVWRGGTSIFMRAVLKAHGIDDRRVFVADSFEGLPPPDDEQYPADANTKLHELEFLSVSLETVQDHFRRLGLLDDQVRFVKGWFRDTMPTLTGEQWSVIRLDGDLYESTITVLENLYPNLSAGGYVIVDDYNSLWYCRKAVTDYREAHGITDEIHEIDWTGAYWRKGDPG
jgi:O-methyltransferase